MEDFREDEDVVEEEDLPLMSAHLLLLVQVGNLIEPAVADETTVWHGQVGLLPHNRLLHFHDLSDVVRAGLKLCGFDPVVNPGQNFSVNVPSVVHAPQVLDKVLQLHASVSLQVRRVKVRVQHDDGKGEDKHAVSSVPELRSAVKKEQTKFYTLFKTFSKSKLVLRNKLTQHENCRLHISC